MREEQVACSSEAKSLSRLANSRPAKINTMATTTDNSKSVKALRSEFEARLGDG
jgi:hypothetical protein